jgi:hypothetical protein
MSETQAKRPMPPAAAPSEPAPPAAAPALPAPEAIPAIARRRSEAATREFLGFSQNAMASLAESQAAMARGIEALALELTGLARSGMEAAGDSTTALLGAKTFADAIEVQIGFARRSIDTLIGSSAKFAEIGVRLANEASRPILSRIADPATALYGK